MKIFNHVCPWGKWPTKSARPTGKSTSPRQLDTGFVEPCSDVRVSNLPACAFLTSLRARFVHVSDLPACAFRARFWPSCVRVSCAFLTFLRARFVRVSDLPACAFRARFWPSCVRVSCAFLTILLAHFVRVFLHACSWPFSSLLLPPSSWPPPQPVELPPEPALWPEPLASAPPPLGASPSPPPPSCEPPLRPTSIETNPVWYRLRTQKLTVWIWLWYRLTMLEDNLFGKFGIFSGR